jgi:hypothetical protein
MTTAPRHYTDFFKTLLLAVSECRTHSKYDSNSPFCNKYKLYYVHEKKLMLKSIELIDLKHRQIILVPACLQGHMENEVDMNSLQSCKDSW